MKAVILAGGFGTRLSEETQLRPKPMVEIGGRPILWHIMKIFSAQGVNDFVVCCGYKGYMIKEYFANYLLHMSDVTIDVSDGTTEVHQSNAEPWRVTLVDTGEGSGTGGRLRRVRPYLNGETFFFTYGDGVASIDLNALMACHREEHVLVTLTAVRPPGRYGAFRLAEDERKICHFREKPRGDGAWVNGGYFVVEPEAIDYIESDATFWEAEPLTKLADQGKLAAYKHQGFWHAMDTVRDRNVLEDYWQSGEPPWRVWS